MQNSKIVSIAILVVMFVYFLFSQIYLTTLGNIYTYIINPLFFVIMAIILKFTILSPYKSKKHTKPIIQYILITVLAYIVIYLLSGLFLTYGKNPYSVGIQGLIFNLYSTGLVLFCREYIRYKVINNVFEKDKKLICILTIIIFTYQEISLISFANVSVYFIFKTIFSVVLPSILRNSLFTYIELYTTYLSGFIYELVIHLVLWIPPILPNAPWIYTAIIDTIFPLLLLLYCIYNISSQDKLHLKQAKKAIEPKGLIPIAIVIVLVIWFAIGIFPIKPIGVATASMEPNLSVGDVVLVQKCNPDEIEIGTIIEYKRKDFSVIHRVIEKRQVEGKTLFITKGDNNDQPDNDPVREDQIQGRVIFRIPGLAWPTIWIGNLRGNSTDVDIQTGK